MGVILGSARVSCWRWCPRHRELLLRIRSSQPRSTEKVRFGATPKPARETHALPNHRLEVLGLGGGLGRGLGVVWGLGVGIGLGVAVGLPEAEAVAVGVGGG
jgi:hypothetical protein